MNPYVVFHPLGRRRLAPCRTVGGKRARQLDWRTTPGTFVGGSKASTSVSPKPLPPAVGRSDFEAAGLRNKGSVLTSEGGQTRAIEVSPTPTSALTGRPGQRLRPNAMPYRGRGRLSQCGALLVRSRLVLTAPDHMAGNANCLAQTRLDRS